MDIYEKKYKDAIKKLKPLYKSWQSTQNRATKEIEDAFPELAESEDEMIRKELIEYCRNTRCVTEEGAERIAKWIAWLEKQGEQKSADKVEPKFNVGEWIIFNENQNSVYQVEMIGNWRYYLRHYLGGTFSVHFDNELIRRWTIEDAWDGDILYSPGNNLLWLHKDMEQCHCCINLNYNSNNISFGSKIVIPSDVCPATKEQRDLLFQKIKDAGYEWEADKKELKKIHVIDEGKAEMDYCFTKMMNGEKIISAWSKEDDDDAWLNDIVSKLESGCQLNKDEINWIKSIKNRVKPQPKKEWSEEDEEMLKWLCRIVHSQMVGKVITLKEESELGEWMDKWLNHNPQPHWKPTDEQLHYLHWIANVKLGDSAVEQELSKHLNELHEDLKKLKGE